MFALLAQPTELTRALKITSSDRPPATITHQYKFMPALEYQSFE